MISGIELFPMFPHFDKTSHGVYSLGKSHLKGFFPHIFLINVNHDPHILHTTFSALNKKECLRRQRRSNQGSGASPLDLDRSHEISMPTKLTQLRYSGYSAEFLDRVEPNGNIPGKNGTSIAGNYFY